MDATWAEYRRRFPTAAHEATVILEAELDERDVRDKVWDALMDDMRSRELEYQGRA